MIIIRCRMNHRIREVYLDISRMIQYGCVKWEQSINDENSHVIMIRSAAKSDQRALPTKGDSFTGMYQNSRLDYQSPYRPALGSTSLVSQILSRQLDLAKPMQFRTYCTDRNQADLPLLTDMKMKEDLSLLSNFSHLLMVYFAIKPQLDTDFSTTEFLDTTKVVIPIIAAKLRSKDLDSLQYMVTDDVFEQIKKNLPKFTESQLEELLVDPDNCALSFIREMNISEDTRQGTKRLQVFTIHHFCNQLKEVNNTFANSFNDSNPINPFVKIPELGTSKSMKVYILNYRFSRTFNLNTGEADDWIVDGLNHRRKVFTPKQLFS